MLNGLNKIFKALKKLQENQSYILTFIGSLPGDFDTTVNPGGQNGNFQFGSGGVNGGGSGATGFPSGGSNFPDGQNGGFGGNGGGSNGGGGFPAGFPGLPGGTDDNDNAIDTGDSDDVNCDYLGTCYDGQKGKVVDHLLMYFSPVSVHCKDTRIVVNVGTNKPFSGRIYALGRSETCNVDVINSDTFRLKTQRNNHTNT